MKSKQYIDLLQIYLQPQRKRVFLLAILLISGIILQLLNPQLVRVFLDGVEAGKSVRQLVTTAVAFTLIAVTAQAIKLAATYIGEIIAWTATNDLRADLALHCLRLDMSFHKTHKPGELIERVDGDVNKLANFFSQLVIQLVSNFLLLVGVIVLLWVVDWRIGTAVTLFGLLGIAGLNWFNTRIIPRWQELRQINSDLFGYLEEWLSGTEEIQTNSAAPYMMRRLYQLMRARWLAMKSAMRLNVGVMGLPIIMPTLAYVAAYVWGTAVYQNGVLTIGTIYLVFYYIDVIKGPLWVIQRQVQDLQQASASLNRIAELFAIQPTIEDGATAVIPTGPLAVQFDHLTFAYEDTPDTAEIVLQDVSFTLQPKRVLGLLGRTGGGKTTLTRLLFRFYDPTKGAIRLGTGRVEDTDGRYVDLRHVSQANIRQRIGLVTQDVELFHASVRDNLTLFDNTIADEQIITALETLGLRQWLDSLPDGLNTKLEASDSLSSGEAQLLALGRVFLQDPGLIIMDEASSRLDPATEHLLETAVSKLLTNRTAIIIAHRLGTVQRADEIMILEDGHILEHNDRTLLANDPNSRFYKLLQTGLEEAIV